LKKSILKSNDGFSIIGIVIAIVVVAIIAVVVYAIWHGIGAGKGNGAGDGEGDGNTKIVTNQESAADEENDTIIEEEDVETQEENENANDTLEGAVVKISVFGNEYLHESERITLDDFIIMIKSIDGDVVVQIKDDNASLKAYNALIDRLEEENISYVEK